MAAGLEDVLRYLEEWRFPDESIDYLVSTRMFHGDFLEYLSGVRFTGDGLGHARGAGLLRR